MDIVNCRPMPMASSAQPIAMSGLEHAERRFYIRFSVSNEAGVLAQITNIFWKYNISIAGVIQKEPWGKGFVPVVLSTYLAKEGNLQAAIREVDRLQIIKAPTRLIRILSPNT